MGGASKKIILSNQYSGRVSIHLPRCVQYLRGGGEGGTSTGNGFAKPIVRPLAPPGEQAQVAGLDGAPDYESGGQEFESLRARH